MDRKEFLKKIAQYFENISGIYLEGYKTVLYDKTGKKIDYDKLHKLFLKEHKYTNAPMPHFFASRLHLVTKSSDEDRLENTIERDIEKGLLKFVGKSEFTNDKIYETPGGQKYLF